MSRTATAVAFALLVGAICGFSQVNSTGSLVGTVTDSTGASVPDAGLRVVEKNTGLTRDSRTDQDGVYRFDLLPAGVYELTVTKPGFATPKFENLEISVSQTTEQNVTLSPSSQSTIVTVEATASTLVDVKQDRCQLANYYAPNRGSAFERAGFCEPCLPRAWCPAR
jgi:hypothetical protein